MTKLIRLAMVLLAVVALTSGLAARSGAARADDTNPGGCGAPLTSPLPQITHIVIVMLENQTYSAVHGDPTDASYEDNTLAKYCGTDSQMYGITHPSGANYLGITSGTLISSGSHSWTTAGGCDEFPDCQTSVENVFDELGAGSWAAYEESMANPCNETDNPPTGTPSYKVGHNPPIWYTDISASDCMADDIPVTGGDLNKADTANNPFDAALASHTLPSLSFITPNTSHDGEAASCSTSSCQLGYADGWLMNFMNNVVLPSSEYTGGHLLVVVTYDEGFAQNHDDKNYGPGEHCYDYNDTSQASCNVPFFVAYKYAPAGDIATPLNLYSVTKTITDCFGLPSLTSASPGPGVTGLDGNYFNIPAGCG